jgi:hypothetical protein
MKSFEIINTPVSKGQTCEWITVKEGQDVQVTTLEGTFQGTVKTANRKGGFMVNDVFVNYGSVVRVDKALN